MFTKIVYLPLKKEWFNMIESGIKTEEYREIKPYWLKRINAFTTHVVFSYGYTKKRMKFEIKCIRTGFGNVCWGAPQGKKVIIIELGKRISKEEK